MNNLIFIYQPPNIRIINIFNNIYWRLLRIMSYVPPHIHQGTTLREYIPTYTVRSDYLPTRVIEGSNPQTNDLLRRYEQEKRRGRVFTQKPVEFNPSRYVSYQTYERVDPSHCIDEQSFSRIARRY